jgi:hypothetical protein
MTVNREDFGTYAVGEYQYAMDFIQSVFATEASTEDQLIVLNFMLDVVKEDLRTDLLSYIFYSQIDFSREFDWPFPVTCRDEAGNEILTEKGKTEVDLAQSCVLVLPWRRDRLYNQIINIFKNDFHYIERNHKAWYFPYISLCYVYNGRHSVASGVGHKKGKIEARQYDITKLFPHVNTDGKYWYNSHTGERAGEVPDFRISIIYEIARAILKKETAPM